MYAVKIKYVIYDVKYLKYNIHTMNVITSYKQSK